MNIKTYTCCLLFSALLFLNNRTTVIADLIGNDIPMKAMKALKAEKGFLLSALSL